MGNTTATNQTDTSKTVSKTGLKLELVDNLAYEIPVADTYHSSFMPHPEGYDEILFRINDHTLCAITKADFLAMCGAAIKLFK